MVNADFLTMQHFEKVHSDVAFNFHFFKGSNEVFQRGEMDMEELTKELSQCYLYLRQNDNDNIQHATMWLTEFYANPISISVLIKFIQGSSDKTDRQHAIVGLSDCFSTVWNQLDPSDRGRCFSEFLSLLTKETVWINRRNLIDVIQKAMTDEFDQPLFQFVQESAGANDDAFLEIALLLGALLPPRMVDQDNFNDMACFFRSLIERGLQSSHPEVRLAAFHFLVYSKMFEKGAFVQDVPEFWDRCIQIIDSFISIDEELGRLVNLFNYSISEKIFSINPIPLLEKCLSYFDSESLGPQTLMKIQTIIQTICHIFPSEVIESGLHTEVIQVHLALAMQLFEPDDTFSMTDAAFFEPCFTDLIKSNETASALWEICQSEVESNSGKFVFIRSLAATVTNVPEFFLDRIDQITELLKSSISSASQLLRDAAARTADDLIKIFVFESDELSLALVQVVLQACQQHPSADLLLVYSRLLDATKKTDDIFETAFPFLIQVLLTGPADMQIAVLPCISSLCRWSSIYVFVYFEQLFQYLNDLLKSTSDTLAHLKSPAIDCFARVASVLGDSFDRYLADFCNYCIENIENEDTSISCLLALESVSRDHKESFTSLIPRVLPFLLQYFSMDYTEEYTKSLITMEESAETLPIPPPFRLSASALRTLSFILISDNSLYEKYSPSVIQACETHKNSFSDECKCAAAIAVRHLVEAFSDVYGDIAELTKQFSAKVCPIVISLLSIHGNIDVNYEAFTTAASIVSWFGYDVLGNYHKIMTDITKEFLSDEEVLSQRPQERGRDLLDAISEFLRKTCDSAGNVAASLLTDLFAKFTEFSKNPKLRLRSFALRFFGDIIRNASSELDPSFKENALQCALSTAENEIDAAPFICMSALATMDAVIVIPYSEQILQLLTSKLDLKLQKTERFLLMRDNCISTFAHFAMNIFKDDLDYVTLLPLILAAMPLMLEFQENPNICSFIFWLRRKVGNRNPEMFLRVLTVLFSNHPSMIEEMCFSSLNLQALKDLTVSLISETEQAKEICYAICENDERKIRYLEENLNDSMAGGE